jgi:hypothetical protein
MKDWFAIRVDKIVKEVVKVLYNGRIRIKEFEWMGCRS